jgi:hypothetical protein
MLVMQGRDMARQQLILAEVKRLQAASCDTLPVSARAKKEGDIRPISDILRACYPTPCDRGNSPTGRK